MRWIRKLIPWLIIAAAIVLVVYLPDIGPEKYTDLATMFKNERIRQVNAGYSVIVCRNGSVIYSESFGKDGSGQALTKDTPMYLGPTSEILSGALLYSMTLQGSIDLDKDIRTYLPRLPAATMNNLRNLDKAEDLPVTVRQLAAHSLDIDANALAEFNTRISGLEAGEFDPAAFFKSRIKGDKVIRSRISYRILGAAIEFAGGKPFDELLQSKLLIPLGMHSTTSVPGSLLKAATGSGLFFGLSFPYDSRVPVIAAPADGILTSPRDQEKFLSFLTDSSRTAEGTIQPRSVPGLYKPLIPGGNTGFGWRLSYSGERKLAYQGGSIEGFSSRIMVWPERSTAIAILSAEGGVIQSNIVLPLLAQAAEKIIFSGSSPKLPPTGRVLILGGIIALVYLLSLFLQIATSTSWAKSVSDRMELEKGRLYLILMLGRTVVGMIARGLLLVAAPIVVARFVGRNLEYHDLLLMEPGFAAFFVIAMSAGILRNISRLAWLLHLRRG
jgi:CubicO group peptidase (beta-lactamase class C family)